MRHLLIIIAAAMFCATTQAQTSAIDQGRALYFGTQAFSSSPRVSGVELPAAHAACVNCHGALGTGSREGAQAAPDITQRLHHKPGAWLQAAMQGHAHDSRALNHLMPRYALTPAEQAALIAYAPLLGQAQDAVRGVSDKDILFGLYTENQPNTLANSYILNGVEHQFNSINRRGGVHGRMLRIKLVRSADEAQAVFALIAGVQAESLSEAQLKQQRLPHLAALTLGKLPASASDWTLPLLPSLPTQSKLLMQTLAEQAVQHNCRPWLIDTAQMVSAQEAAALKLQHFHDVAAAISALTPDSNICLGMLTSPRTATELMQQLQSKGVKLSASITLAVLNTQPIISSAAQQYQVLPVPSALAEHAQAHQQSLWASLGEAAAQAVIEALSRSGRALQPELVLANMRQLTGYAPIADAPEARLAWGKTQAHGFAPSLIVLPAAHTAAADNNTVPNITTAQHRHNERSKGEIR